MSKFHFIYGNSGSGKTSLLNAIMKRIKIKDGSIKFLNLYDNYTYFSIRKYLVLLLSESALFSKSLYYNITYGINNKILIEKNDDIMQEIIKYMNIFGLTIFIQDIKRKNATKLSKGQTQKVAIIRFFINIIFNNARIIFLDEFTSNIDNSMEEIIFKELINLHKIHRFTVFYISHNLYNIKYSDFNYKFNVDEHSITKNRSIIDG
jgi:ATP-binding cassette subfamily B protein